MLAIGHRVSRRPSLHPMRHRPWAYRGCPLDPDATCERRRRRSYPWQEPDVDPFGASASGGPSPRVPAALTARSGTAHGESV